MEAPVAPELPGNEPARIPEKHRRLLSSFRLKSILTIFIVCLLASVTGLTFLLITRIFHRFDAAVRSDLEWKALRGSTELAAAVDLGVALGDGDMVTEGLGEYRSSADVLAVVALGASGEPVAHFGATLTPPQIRALFLSRPETVHASEGYVWSWASSRIEGKIVGQVAVLISLTRLHEAAHLRKLLLELAAGGCVVALFISLFFVNFYLGPLLRFTEATLRNLEELNATLEKRVEDRTLALKKSLDALQTAQRQLADASRQAGMAEVATTVLHNVGNVLNSVNVSCNLIIEKVRRSRISDLGRLPTLLRDNQSELGPFFTTHPKGRKVIDYLAATGEAAAVHQVAMLSELQSLQRNVDHIKTIVRQQQTHAKTMVGVLETMPISEVLDEAIHFSSLSFDSHALVIVRDYQEIPPARLDRHKLLQIFMNLLSNARHALQDTEITASRGITVRIQRGESDRFQISVEDTGCGIAAENLTRVFSYGFTTKKEGHGFGLHSAACAALEMGGTLTAHSEGLGQGARFILDLPILTADEGQKVAAA
jgi:signal transduction histidine kinase